MFHHHCSHNRCRQSTTTGPQLSAPTRHLLPSRGAAGAGCGNGTSAVRPAPSLPLQDPALSTQRHLTGRHPVRDWVGPVVVPRLTPTTRAVHCLFLLQSKPNVVGYLQNYQVSQEFLTHLTVVSANVSSRQDLNSFSLSTHKFLTSS
jgi:hypothetical protein